MIFLIVITLYPFIYIAFASVSDPSRLISYSGPLYMPLGFSLAAYKAVLANPMILLGYRNTLFYVFAGTSVNIVMTCLGAYVLTRKGVYWRNAIMMFCVFTMFFSGGLIPFYLTVHSLKLTNTVWSLIFPTAVSTFNLIVMRTYFLGIPDSMEESAKIDGAGDFRILFRIFVPLAMPVIAVILLFYGVSHWNAWFYAMIFLRKREMFPLQLILREILISSSMDEMVTGASGSDKEALGQTIKYATIMVATLPILFIYPFLQKYFVKGVMVGALKG